MTRPIVWQPLRDVIAEAIYMDPVDLVRSDFPHWNDLPAARREPWLADADRIIAVLTTRVGCTPRMEQAIKDKGDVFWLASRPAEVLAEMFRAEQAAVVKDSLSTDAANSPEIPDGSPLSEDHKNLIRWVVAETAIRMPTKAQEPENWRWDADDASLACLTDDGEFRLHVSLLVRGDSRDRIAVLTVEDDNCRVTWEGEIPPAAA